MKKLDGKIVVITGATSGFGEAAARLFAGEGAKVVLAARRKARLEKLVSELGPQAMAIPCDVSKQEDVNNLFEEIKKNFGGIDLLFNNAGMGYSGPFVNSNSAEWRQQIDTNVYGVIACTYAAIPLMKNRDGAMISSVSSLGGRYGYPDFAVYCATKFAVVGFHDALRKEVGNDGIRVSVIEPGAAWTEFGHNVPKEDLSKRRASLEALSPEDVAQALYYTYTQPRNVLIEEIVIRPVKQVVP